MSGQDSARTGENKQRGMSTSNRRGLWLLMAAVNAWLWGGGPAAIPAAAGEKPMDPGAISTARATLGGGCFWCLEAVFERFEGVRSVTSGYAGGHTQNPTYKDVCSGRTGHAEVVQIEFDPARITYARILEIFWEAHDPTTLNRQGADLGSQYRSIILYHDETQRQGAEQSRRQAAAKFRDPIVTELVALERFFPAEAYHQDYFRTNPNAPYCRVVIHPKLEKLEQTGLLPAR